MLTSPLHSSPPLQKNKGSEFILTDTLSYKVQTVGERVCIGLFDVNLSGFRSTSSVICSTVNLSFVDRQRSMTPKCRFLSEAIKHLTARKDGSSLCVEWSWEGSIQPSGKDGSSQFFRQLPSSRSWPCVIHR